MKIPGVAMEWNGKKVSADVRKALEKATGEGADNILKAAKTTTDFKDDTGNLRRSIVKKKSRFKNGGHIVKTSAPHAHLVEYGCRNGQQRPRPFLRNAVKSQKIKIMNGLKRALAGAVK